MGTATAVTEAERPTVHDIPVSLKSTLVDDHGVAFRDFRRTLTPRWGRVWAELLAGYVVVAATMVALIVWGPTGLAAVGAGAAGALVMGYAIAYVNNFLHESAHYNLLPGRKANDVATNVLMSWLFASSIAQYRRVHFVHHRALGTTMDAETAYFDPLRVRTLVEGLIGVRALRTVRRRDRMEGESDPTSGRLLWVGIAAAVNGAIAVALALTGQLAALIGWVGAMAAVFPFFITLRQTLEHRAEDAESGVDYHEVDHGAVNRLFGDGPVSNTMGSAGFNRHALHHWEPQLSYTRLKDLERYLARTPLAPEIQSRQTSYPQTFLRLLEL